ncbi:hypothetical protein, partial [Aquibaculum arenosum]
DNTEGSLQAPAQPGLYEVRYILNEGRKTLASAAIEIVEAEASVSAPEQATVGAAFQVSWSNSIHPQDYVTIVPMGAEEGESGAYIRTRDNTEGSLQAPAQPGLYEVRYILNEGRKTLASAAIEIVEAEVTVSAPAQVVTGASFQVSWTNPIHPQDYVTIVPMGTGEGEYGNYTRTRDNTQGSVTAPATPGLYEVRYILNEGGKTLASAEVEVVEAGMELSGPDTVRAGDQFRVAWTGSAPSPRDYVSIAPLGSDDGDYETYVRVRDAQEADLTAPETMGFYQLRYVLDEGRRVLARHDLEVVSATAALDDGGSLSVPETGTPGESIAVTWQAEDNGNDRRIALAQADQADFTWIEMQSASGEELTFTLPDASGTYEFRLLDISERKVLSRAIIQVQ